ncbi:putative damage-inducible protein DinB [Paenibacillus sp. PastF-4]|nr:putative damage-inducible protein DinB [Paenibacillus sp. PastF-4]
MVREQWYEWCGDISEEELLATRIGGVGSILKTLFHIVDVEWSWI